MFLMLDALWITGYHTRTMTHGIEIHEDIIKGLTPELKKPEVFSQTHHLASENNPLLHLFHQMMITGLRESTSYTEMSCTLSKPVSNHMRH